MPRLSVNQLTTFRWSLEEDLQHYKTAGISAIGVWRRKLVDSGEPFAINLIRESGLAVSNLVWAGGFTGSDGHSFQESLDDAREAIDLAAALACPTLVVYSGGRGGHTLNHARRLALNALQQLLPLAERHGVVLALEPVHPHYAAEWSVCGELAEAVNCVNTIGSPHLKLVFDTYHLGWSCENIRLLDQIVPHLAVVHLGDGKKTPEYEQDRCRLGDGEIPLAQIVETLQARGYDGDYDVELLGPEIERSNYLELLNHSKAVFERLVTHDAGAEVAG